MAGICGIFLEAFAQPQDEVVDGARGREDIVAPHALEHAGEIVSREDLLEKVWGYDMFPSTRTVDNFILRLRKRFERDPANPKHFLTVWGVGYRFMIEGEP